VKADARPSHAWLAVILGSATALSPLSVDMYLPALPLLQRDFGVTAAAAQQTLSMFLFGMATTQLLFGPLSDSLGRKRLLLAGLGGYVLASIGCALASGIDQFSALRLVQAMGGAAGGVLGRAVARDHFDGHALARLFSMIALVMGLGPVLAPLIGTAVLTIAPWRAIFWLLAALGTAAFLLVALSLRESLRPERRPARPMAASFAAMRTMLGSRAFMGYAVAVSLSWGAMFCYIVSSPFIFMVHFGLPRVAFAGLFCLNALGLMASSQLNLRLLGRYAPATLLRAGLTAEAILMLVLLLLALTGLGGAPAVAVVLFAFLFSCGLVSPNALALAMGPFAHAAGAAAALVGVFQGVLGGLTTGLVGSLPGGGVVPMASMMLIAVLCAFAAGVLVAGRPGRAPHEAPRPA
jgi:DHA1 family bicyclomycin/chloramphenicol resistance-like MFS transporter